MKRPIKFRAVCAFNVDSDVSDDLLFRKGEMLFGQVVFYDDTPFIVGPVAEVDGDDITLGSWVQVEPETVGQFTGLTDKNGVEIYEGDVIENTTDEGDDDVSRCVVEYHAPAFVRRYLDADNWDGIARDGLSQWNLDVLGWHVVGNIYQNPELLEAR